jgi:hypothetical protein
MKTTISRARNPPLELSVREPPLRTRGGMGRLYPLKPAMPLLLAIAVTAAMGCHMSDRPGDKPSEGTQRSLVEARAAGSLQQEIEPLIAATHEWTKT